MRHERARLARSASVAVSAASASTGARQPVLRIANRELRGVHAHRDAARAGGHVVARERALVPLVERARSGERERMRGDHDARARDGSRRSRHAQNAPVALFEVRRLAEQRSARAAPTRPPTRAAWRRHGRRAEQRMRARRVAEQRVRRLAPVNDGARARQLAEARGELAHGERLAAGDVHDERRRARVRETAQRPVVRVALPDDVDVSHRADRSARRAARARRCPRARRSGGRPRS